MNTAQEKVEYIASNYGKMSIAELANKVGEDYRKVCNWIGKLRKLGIIAPQNKDYVSWKSIEKKYKK